MDTTDATDDVTNATGDVTDASVRCIGHGQLVRVGGQAIVSSTN